MAEELEIKLSVSADHQQAAVAWLLGRAEASDGACKRLANRYYDTPSGELNRQRVALRVRQAGGQNIQTLKTQGEFVDGAHRRQEWEWPLMGTELNIGLVADTPVGQGVNLAELKPVFETNFERQVIMINEGDTAIEVAVDTGSIVAGSRERPLHEIEFELKSGDPSRLVRWARALAAQVPVFLNLVSKAEQGYYLAGIHQPHAVTGSSPLSVPEFLHQLSVYWLLESPVNFPGPALENLRQAAAQAGVEGRWQKLESEILGGHTVQGLIDNVPRLGELQLVLASSN
ncbi:CYTH domain-containing protein [Marinobacter sp.]|uniref:CYTH domain-containing protein n=1 Tax=Marinobacter sp. TaxID=50741 RepID=UPI0034A2F733